MSKKEVHDALFSIANDKSPGMDVYNVEFFKTHWSTVGPDVTEAVQLFFTTGHLLKEWIALLSSYSQKSVRQKRYNISTLLAYATFYISVLASAWLTQRRSFLPSLIADSQNAFVQGRQMEDKVLISHELTHCINKQLV